MAYFSNFANIDYDFDGSGIQRSVKNLAQYSTIISKNIDDATFYSYYNIQDGARPDNVSEELYGTPEYYWTFFIVNNDPSSPSLHATPSTAFVSGEHIPSLGRHAPATLHVDDAAAHCMRTQPFVTGG